MNHLASETLHLYLDRQLDPAERAVAEAHLATCPPCREEAAQLAELFATLDELPPAPLPIDLAPRVMAAIAPPRPRWRAALTVAALGAQLALTALLLLRLLPPVSAWAVSRLGALPPLPAVDVEALVWSSLAGPLADLQRLWAELGALAALTPAPLADLAPMQWALLLAALAVVWAVGNRVLLAGAHVSAQEVAR